MLSQTKALEALAMSGHLDLAAGKAREITRMLNADGYEDHFVGILTEVIRNREVVRGFLCVGSERAQVEKMIAKVKPREHLGFGGCVPKLGRIYGRQLLLDARSETEVLLAIMKSHLMGIEKAPVEVKYSSLPGEAFRVEVEKAFVGWRMSVTLTVEFSVGNYAHMADLEEAYIQVARNFRSLVNEAEKETKQLPSQRKRGQAAKKSAAPTPSKLDALYGEPLKTGLVVLFNAGGAEVLGRVQSKSGPHWLVKPMREVVVPAGERMGESIILRGDNATLRTRQLADLTALAVKVGAVK